jgi:hypothetical protein
MKVKIEGKSVSWNGSLLVDDHLLQLSLGGGPLHDLLVNGPGSDQPAHTTTAPISLLE